MENDPPLQRPPAGGFMAACFSVLLPLLLAAPLGAVPAGPEGATGEAATAAPVAWARSVAVIAVFLFLNGLLAMGEASLLSLRRARLSQLMEEKNRTASLIVRLLEEPGRLLISLRVGMILTSAGIAVISAETFGNMLYRALLPWLGPESASWENWAVGGAAFLAALAVIGFDEIALKSVALQHIERVAFLVARPVQWVYWLLSPLVVVMVGLGSLLLSPFGMAAKTPAPLLTQEELKMIVEAGEEEGVLEEEEKEMIHSIFEFTDTVVRKVMTPRIDISCVEVTATLDEVVEAILKGGHTRIPVYAESIDNIIGIVHAKDLLRLLDGWQGAAPLGEVIERQKERGIFLLRDPYFIPENKRADELLAEFRQSKNQLAVVIDEHGGTAGLVTVEDLVEEIVGDILDEYDVEEKMVEVEDDRTSVIDARMPIDDFNEQMGIELPEEEFDTVGGFVFGLFGKLPTEGEGVRYESLCITVLATDGHRIQKIRITRQPPPPEEEPADATPIKGKAGSGG
ncbi:MAG: HlyC/CorC family transporter [Armatimonadetes bacterium]|nr:HlyC/CorC family transporter [Armatimonadota bacterium]